MRPTERELETFICNHPEQLFGYKVEIIGRQVALPHGRLDLLAWDDENTQTFIVELKVECITEHHVGQVMRYFHDVHAMMYEQVMFKPENHLMPRGQFALKWNGGGDNGMLPILAGPSITDKAQAAAHGAGCAVILWEFNAKLEHKWFFGKEAWAYGAEIPLWATKLERRALDHVHGE